MLVGGWARTRERGRVSPARPSQGLCARAVRSLGVHRRTVSVRVERKFFDTRAPRPRARLARAAALTALTLLAPFTTTS